ncbi:SCO family protein [Aestuariivirga sp.]|uniref:SCO family protein n=1 Tax=Aestuariivirga sp. TaxID=2650926 RepID=UPI0039E442C3
MPQKRTLLFAALMLVVAAMIGATAWLLSPGLTRSGTGVALVGGPFTLTNQDGKQVTEKDFLGRYTLVYFGYTYCPDVCPTQLQVLAAALEEMGPAAAKITPVFISIDPGRDTPEVMKAYVENFGAQFVGLTGSADEIAGVAKAYRVFYAKTGTGADYKMDHTSLMYLMGPDGKFVTYFDYTTDPKALAQRLSQATAASSS